MKRLFPALLLVLLLVSSLQDRAWAASTPPKKTASGSPGENPNKHATFNPVLTIQLQRDAEMWGEGTVLDVDVGPNLYAYVKQNPWTFFDPLGLKYSDQFDDDGYLKLKELRGSEYRRARQFNESWKDIRETEAGQNLHQYIRESDTTVNIELSARELSEEGGAGAGGADVLKTGENAVSVRFGEEAHAGFERVAEEMIHVSQHMAKMEYEKQLGVKFDPNNKQHERSVSIIQGNAVPGLPIHVEGDERFNSEPSAASIGSMEVQAARGVNIITLQSIAQTGKHPRTGKRVNQMMAVHPNGQLKHFLDSKYRIPLAPYPFGNYNGYDRRRNVGLPEIRNGQPVRR